MTAAHPLPPPTDPVLDALSRAPVGQEDMSPEQRAEFAEIVAAFDAGHARLVPHADVPRALEGMAGERRQ